LIILDISNPLSPQQLSRIEVNSQSIDVKKNYLFIIPYFDIIRGNPVFRIYDITNFENPIEIIWEGIGVNPTIWITLIGINFSLLVAFVLIVVNSLIKNKIRRNL
jgi:hypothetical protein